MNHNPILKKISSRNSSDNLKPKRKVKITGATYKPIPTIGEAGEAGEAGSEVGEYDEIPAKIFSPPPSPYPYDPNNDDPIPLGVELEELMATKSALRQKYLPIIMFSDINTPKFTYSEGYTGHFTHYLSIKDIKPYNDTRITTLERELVNMFREIFNKKVLACDFFRGVHFDKNKSLGDYSTYITDYGGDGEKDYFYINVIYENITPYNLPVASVRVDPKEEFFDAGGSRKRRKGGKKKTIKRRRKTIKRRKSGKKRKTIRRRK
jgi:hypothetical protein